MKSGFLALVIFILVWPITGCGILSEKPLGGSYLRETKVSENIMEPAKKSQAENIAAAEAAARENLERRLKELREKYVEKEKEAVTLKEGLNKARKETAQLKEAGKETAELKIRLSNAEKEKSAVQKQSAFQAKNLADIKHQLGEADVFAKTLRQKLVDQENVSRQFESQRDSARRELDIIRPKAKGAEEAQAGVKKAQAVASAYKIFLVFTGFACATLVGIILVILYFIKGKNREIELQAQKKNAALDKVADLESSRDKAVKELSLYKPGSKYEFSFPDPVSKRILTGRFTVDSSSAEKVVLICDHCAAEGKNVPIFVRPPEFENLRSHIRKDNGATAPVIAPLKSA